jgi:hypothetical protein
MYKGGIIGEGITNILLWIIFIIIGATAIYFIVKGLTG